MTHLEALNDAEIIIIPSKSMATTVQFHTFFKIFFFVFSRRKKFNKFWFRTTWG